MKRLGLLRHAKSNWDDISLRDFDRGLNRRGRRGAALMGAHVREHGVPWDMVLASPAERVRRTLESGGLGLPVQFEQDAYLGDAATLMRLLRALEGDPAAVLAAGHNPGLQELALDLVAPDNENALFGELMVKFPTAAFAVLELDIGAWRDIAPGCARLVHFARPRDLDPELGPEKKGR